MGVPGLALSRLLSLYRAGLIPKGAAMLELSEQNLSSRDCAAIARRFAEELSGEDFSDRTHLFDEMANGGLSGDLFELAGLDIVCIEIFEGKRNRIVDLNDTPPFPEFINHFDVVTNFGTTEHILNQYHCFKYIHDCVKVGGLMVHQLPIQGWRDHCLVTYNPKFFFLLAMANGYSLVDFRINAGGENSSDVSYWTSLQRDVLGPVSSIGGPDQNKGMFVALRKERAGDFVAPIDKTSKVLSPDELKDLAFTPL